MATAIAKVGGVALAPGVSRNRRLYTKKAIAGLVVRAQDRLASPDGLPITMLTHHAAEDDSTRVVGRVTSISLDDQGNARYQGEIADTDAGRTIAGLADTSDGKPAFLAGVSIRGAWVGTTRVVKAPDGDPAETGDDMELVGLDFTHKPGVPAAGIDTFSWTDHGTKSETSERVLITESVQEALVAITEETTQAGEQSCAEMGHACCKATTASESAAAFQAFVPEPGHVLEDGFCTTCAITEAGTPMSKRTSGIQGTGGPFADPGYQKDGKQRYQLDNKAHAKAAWAFISKADNAKAYTAAQLKRIKGRIMAAMKKFGVKAASEGWTIDPAVELTEAIAECYAMDCDPQQSGSWSISASNGPVNICLSAYRMDPAELDVILRAAADGACQALAALDPDMDGDIDVDGAPNADTDDDGGESAPEDDPAAAGEAGPAATAESDVTPAPVPAAGETTETEGSPMPETTTPAAESAPAAAPTYSKADLDAAVAAGIAAADEQRRARKAAKQKPAESAPAAAVSETAPGGAVTETEDQRIERLVAAKLAESFPAETDDQRMERKVQEAYDAAYASMVHSGQIDPGRKGIVRSVAESTPGAVDQTLTASGIPASWGKELHQMSQEEFDRLAGPVITRHVLGSKADLLA